MSKRANRFQQTPPAMRFFREHASVKDQSHQVCRPAPPASALTKIWDGTHRVGVLYFCENHLSNAELIDALSRLKKLKCVPEDSAALAERFIEKTDVSSISSGERAQLAKAVSEAFYLLKMKPRRANLIIGQTDII